MDLLWWHGRACHRHHRRSHRGLAVWVKSSLDASPQEQWVTASFWHLRSHTKQEKHVSFAMTVALRMDWMQSLSIPLDQEIFMAYRDCPDDNYFPRDVVHHWKVLLDEHNSKHLQKGISEGTRSMLTSLVGVVLVRSLVSTKTISNFFLQVKLRLILHAHSSTIFGSWTQLSILVAGMTRSLANLNIWFPGLIWWKS